MSGACLGKSEEGSISGEKGCVVPSSKFSIQNLFTDKSAKTILVEWENSAVCPNVEIAEIEINKSVSYTEKTDSVKCGKLKKVTGKRDVTDCTALENAEPADIYFKTDSADKDECVITTTPKTLG